MSDIQHIESHTPDLTEENVDKLAALFPDVLTEVTDPQTGEIKKAIDFDVLRDKLGDVAEGTRERYQFTWPGKRAAKAEARRPISKTLRPVKERSKNWDTTQNLYIEGDNLDALKILRETYAGKIKLIYIDPPYNTGHDFIYKDNFGKTVAADKAENGDWDDEGGQLVANPESNGRFHSDWCSSIYPSLCLSRDLLTSDGAIFISIDDHEVSSLIKIMDELYGYGNRVAIICHKSRGSVSNDKIISSNHNFILFYAKNIEVLESKKKNIGLDPVLSDFNLDNNDGLGAYKLVPVDGPGGAKKGNPYYEFLGVSGYWRFSQETMSEKYDKGLIVKSGNGLYQKYFLKDAKQGRKTTTTWWEDGGLISTATSKLKKLMGGPSFDTPKPVELIERMVQMITNDDPEAVIADFFSGSATTAESVMEANAKDNGNRHFILVQIPELINKKTEAYKAGYSTVCEIGEERIRRAGEKIKAEVEAENAQGKLDGEVKQVPDIGFRVLRVDSSSYEDVRKTPAEFSQGALDLDEDNTKEGRSSLDLLFECLPTFQLPYTSSIATLSSEPFDGYTVYSVNDAQLLACFDEDIPESLIRGMVNFEPKPSYVVVAEKSLSDSAARTNFAEIFKQSANALEGQTQIRII